MEKSTHSIVIESAPPAWNCAVWCRVYKRDLIKDRRFKEDMKVGEDWLFNLDLKPMTKKIVKKQVYIYNIRLGSLTGRKEL